MRRLSGLLALWLCGALVLRAEPAAVPEYRGFSVLSPQDLNSFLNRYAAEGYRLISLSPAPERAAAALMQHTASGGYDYVVITGSFGDKGQGQFPILEWIQDAARQGYRVVPGSLVFEKQPVASMVMERGPGAGEGCTYRAFARDYCPDDALQQEVQSASAEGYGLVLRRWWSLVFERCSRPSATAAGGALPRDRLPGKPGRKEPAQGEDPEWLIIPASGEGWSLPARNREFWLRAAESPPLRVVLYERELKSPFPDYAAEVDVFVERINQAAAEGYRLAGIPQISGVLEPAFLHTRNSIRFSAALQRSPRRYEYRVIREGTFPRLAEKINGAAADGYRVVSHTLDRTAAVLMERELSGEEAGR